MGDPDAGAGAHDGLERGDEAARRVNDTHAAIFDARVDVGLAVGDDDDPLAVQVAVESLLEPLRRPVAALAVGLLLGDDALDEIPDIPEDGLELGPLRPGLDEAPQLPAPSAPRQARGDDGYRGGGGRQEPEGQEQEQPGLGFPTFDEAEIVDEDDEPQRPLSIEYGDGADVNVSTGERFDALPRDPAGAASPRPWRGRACRAPGS